MKQIMMIMVALLMWSAGYGQATRPLSGFPVMAGNPDTGTYMVVIHDSAGQKLYQLFKVLRIGNVNTVKGGDSTVIAAQTGGTVAVTVNPRYSYAWQAVENYAANYGSSYTSRSMVDKNYSDSARQAYASGPLYNIPMYSTTGQVPSSLTDTPGKVTIGDTLVLPYVPNAINAADSFLVRGAVSKKIREIGPVLGVQNGATGIGVYTVTGAIPMSSSSVTMTPLVPGSTGQLLQIDPGTGLPTWKTVTFAGSVTAADASLIINPSSGAVTGKINPAYSNTMTATQVYSVASTQLWATTNGGLMYTNGSGVMQQLGAGTAGQTLQWISGMPTWTTSATGVSSVSGTNSGGVNVTIANPTTTPVITATLTPTGVTAGAYGSASSVATYTVGADGRMTNSANVPIALSYTAVTTSPAYVTTVTAANTGSIGSASVTLTPNINTEGQVISCGTTPISITPSQIPALQTTAYTFTPTETFSVIAATTINMSGVISGGTSVSAASLTSINGITCGTGMNVNIGDVTLNNGQISVTQGSGAYKVPLTLNQNITTGGGSIQIWRSAGTKVDSIDGSGNFVGLQNMTIFGSERLNSSQTTVSASTSVSAIFSEPEQGTSYKKCIIYLNAALGTASYTFPTAFVNTPVVSTTSGLASSIVTTLTTTTVIVTGTTSTGFLIIEGY